MPRMYKCKYYKMSFMQPYTCIKKQIRVHELLKRKDVLAARGCRSGVVAIREATVATDYYGMLGCFDCKKGQKFYQKYLDGKIEIPKHVKGKWNTDDKQIKAYIKTKGVRNAGY